MTCKRGASEDGGKDADSETLISRMNAAALLAGPATGSLRGFRGGSWLDVAGGTRCADRNGFYPDFASLNIGFRAVLAPGQP